MAPVISYLLSLLFISTAFAAPTIEKRGIRAPAHRYIPKRALSARAEGAVEAATDGGGWIMPVLIGGQQVSLNLDTGSSDLWTTSTLMASHQRLTVTSGEMYNPNKSSTYRPMNGSRFDLEYADGSGASGPAALEKVDIGGAIVPDMPIGVCSDLQYGSGETSRDTNGPVGLGFGAGNSIRPNPQCTFMECLEPYVPEPLFCTSFHTDDTGFVNFGYIDNERHQGPLTTVPIANTSSGNEGQWVAEGVRFGSGGKLFANVPRIDMDFDSGTSSLSLPAAAAAAYFALVPGSDNSTGGWTFPCNATLPDFDYHFTTAIQGPNTVTVPGENVRNGNGTTGSCGTWIDVVEGRANAGVPFYITKYMIWNQKKPTLSFADQA